MKTSMRTTKILQGISSVLLLIAVLLMRASENPGAPPEFGYMKWGVLAVAVVLLVIVAVRLARHRKEI